MSSFVDGWLSHRFRTLNQRILFLNMLGVVMSGNDNGSTGFDAGKLGKEILVSKLIAVVFFVTLLVFYFGNFHHLSDDNTKWGAFGDYVGGLLNPVLAFMAFYWLTRSIQIQLKEFEKTREAFEQSSHEQAKAAEAQTELVKQQKIATQAQEESSRVQQLQSRVQAFESSFFSMMNHKVDVVSNICLSSKVIAREESRIHYEVHEHYAAAQSRSLVLASIKRDIFDEMNFFISMRGKGCITYHLLELKEDSKDCGSIQIFWDYFYLEHFQEHFSSYFRVCYHIVKFIHFSEDISGDFLSNSNLLISYKSRKKIYFDIFRSQLSSSELQLIFFNCLGTVGERHFKGLSELYGLFEHLPFDEKESCKNRCVSFAYLYKKSAFEDNEKWVKYFSNIEMAGEDGIKNRKKYGIDENQYQEWKNPTQPKDQDDEAK